MPEGWEWDETLYLGSAPYYLRGRLPYAPGLAERLRAALALDGAGRLLDVGCGPGVLALSLAPLFVGVVGVDPDAGMLAEAARRAAEAGVVNARWVRLRAELPRPCRAEADVRPSQPLPPEPEHPTQRLTCSVRTPEEASAADALPSGRVPRINSERRHNSDRIL